MARPRIIKKYPNRRLYDTEISSYITLEEVRQLVTENQPFEVRDARSGADLTRAVLLQIIAECEEHGEPILSTRLLSQVIRCYGGAAQGLVAPWLETNLQACVEQPQAVRAHLENLPKRTAPADDKPRR